MPKGIESMSQRQERRLKHRPREGTAEVYFTQFPQYPASLSIIIKDLPINA